MQQTNSYESPGLASTSELVPTETNAQVCSNGMAGDNDFKYKIDNPSIITKNLGSILFQEEFADVVLVCGADANQGGTTVSLNKVDEAD